MTAKTPPPAKLATSPSDQRSLNFDRIARPYIWMEYLTFGPMLERCRFALLDHLGDSRNALVLGDGDGRFLTQLLKRHPQLCAQVVDLSPAMLSLAQARIIRAGSTHRATFHQADVRKPATLPATSDAPFDLVTAHFLLDCLTTEETASLIQNLLPILAPDATFVVSEFAIPDRQPFRLLGRLLVIALYKAFALLTRLTVQRLPAYAEILDQAGFQLLEERTFLGGILRTELWRRQPYSLQTTSSEATLSRLEPSQRVCLYPSNPL